MNNNNKSAKGQNRRGRPEEPLEVRLEFIQMEEADERWDTIFELLESAQSGRDSFDTDNTELEQMTLF